MGQYYRIFNLDKNQFFCPSKLGDCTKLLGFGRSSPGAMAATILLLSEGNGLGKDDFSVVDPLIGSWSGDRIVISGDYADPGRFTINKEKNLFRLANEQFENIGEKLLNTMAKDPVFRKVFKEEGLLKEKSPRPFDAVLGGEKGPRPFDAVLANKPQSWRFLNLDKRERILASDFGQNTMTDILTTGIGVSTALAVLLSDGNGRGGGDLRSGRAIIGSWAGDRIIVCGSLSKNQNFNSRFKNVGEDIILALASDAYIREELKKVLPSKQRKLLR